MPENHATANIPDDELDVMKLLHKLINFIRTYFLLIAICTLAGCIVGYGMYKLKPKRYTSRLVLHSTLLSNQEQMAVIYGWSELQGRGELQELSRQLNCSPAILQKLVAITSAEIVKTPAGDNQSGLFIDVVVLDVSILDSLQKGIIYGLTHNPNIKARIEQKTADLRQMVATTKEEIRKFDSVWTAMATKPGHASFGPSAVIMNASNMNLERVQLTEKLLQYQWDLKFVDTIQVLQGFYTFNVPVEPILSHFLLMGFCCGLVAGGFIALLLSMRKKFL